MIARPPVRSPAPDPPWPTPGAPGYVAFGKLMKVNHPAPGDVVRDPAHVAAYGTAFEGTISLRIRDEDGTVIAQRTAQGGSNGVIGEFKANLQFDRRLNQRLGVVEAFEESASGSSEDLHLDRGPIVFA